MAASAIIAGAAVGASLLDSLLQNSANSKNYKAQKEILEWQKAAQEKTWNREDDAIRRRVADLRAAGLSPVLAAGQGAQSSAPIQVTAPQMKPNAIGAGIGSGMEKAMMAQQLMASNASIAHTKAQEDLTRQQIENAKVEGAMKAHDLAIARKDHLSSNPSQAGKMYRDISSVADGFIDSLKTDMQQGRVESVNDYYKNMIEGARKKQDEKDLLDRAKRAKKSQSDYYEGIVNQNKNSQYYKGKAEKLRYRR